MTRTALTMALAAIVMLSAVPADAKAKYVIKFGTVAPEGTPWAKQLKRIKKRIEKQSNGQIKMKLFLGGVLGGEVEMVRALRRGRIQGFGGSTASVAEGAKMNAFMLMEFPFLFNSFKEADHILDKVIKKDFRKLLFKKGFIFAQWHENGWRNFATKKKPILALKDIKGMKMRSQESPVHLAMYKALGVQAESIPVPEVLGALKTGMVDGFDNTPLFSSATGWYEGIKFYTISQHIYQPAVIMYSKKFFDKLPVALRKIVIGDEPTETKKGRSMVRGMRGALLANFKASKIKVVTMTAAQRKPFVAACKSVHNKFASKVGRKLFAKVQKALAKMRK